MRTIADADRLEYQQSMRVWAVPGVALLLFFGFATSVVYRKYITDFGLEATPPSLVEVLLGSDLKSTTKEAKSKAWAAYSKDVWNRLAATPSKPRVRKSTLSASAHNASEQERAGARIPELITRYKELAAISEPLAAKEAYKAALAASHPREKRELLVRAISLLRPERTTIDVDAKPSLVNATAPNDREMRYVTLAGELDKLFPVPDYLPSRISARMVRELLLALLSPGKDVNVFGANYRPGDTLKRMVTQRYQKRGINFQQKEFVIALTWLVGQQVVLEGTKTDEATYSLASSVKNVKSDAARRLMASLQHVSRSL